MEDPRAKKKEKRKWARRYADGSRVSFRGGRGKKRKKKKGGAHGSPLDQDDP